MSDSDNLEIESVQPPAKKAKQHYDMLRSYHSQQSSQGSQNIIIGHHLDHLNKRHTTNFIGNNNQKERQKRYRERNREKLKQREAERRKRMKSQSIIGPSSSSNSNIMKVNNEELTTTAISQSLSGVDKTQPSPTQRNDQDKKMNALQNKRDRHKRYREKNRDKLKQREAERRRRLQNAESIIEFYTSQNIERGEIITEPIVIIDEVSPNSDDESDIRDFATRLPELNPFEKLYRNPDAAVNEDLRIARLDRFPDKNTRTVARRKSAAFIAEHNIDKRALAIVRRTSKICLNNYKTIVGKRNHFPLISGCAMTIHKSQGGTHNEVMYEYNKSHSIPLQHEFKKISLNRLTTLQRLITDFMNSRNKLTSLKCITLNCQSLKKHAADLQNSICKNSNFLLLTETWCPAHESVDLPNFHCIAKFKPQNVRIAGVAINKNNTSHITTLNMDLTVQNATEVDVSQTSIGDMCSSHVKLEDGSELIMIVVYILPNKKMDDIISFLHERLFPYSQRGSIIFKTNKDKLPLILAGDFNVNFAKAESMPLMTFLQEEFQLQINNNPTKSTTKYGTTIDAVFVRNLDNVLSNTFVTYFSYHRPIVTVIPSGKTSNVTITEVTDKN